LIDTKLRYGGAQISENLWTGRTKVPDLFLGQHFHRWPGTSPAPTYPYHFWRSHDCEGTLWRQIHTGPGKFDQAALARLDVAMDSHAARDAYCCFTVYGTPQWCSSQPDRKWPYGGTGGSAAPSDMKYMEEFVSMIVKRYNTDDVRDNQGRKHIKWIESANEPIGDVPPEKVTFYTGTAQQLVDMARVTRDTAKAIDPEILSLGPSWCGVPEISWFFNAGGAQYLDGIAFHPYSTSVLGFKLGRSAPEFNSQIRMVTLLPIYGMEHGITGGPSSVPLWRPEEKARYVAACTAMYAALGWRTVAWYGHDDELSGNPSTTPVVATAMDWCCQLAGKTLLSVDRGVDGAIMVRHTRGKMVF
jgi:hypothetical protein